jgi:hypothetical protein
MSIMQIAGYACELWGRYRRTDVKVMAQPQRDGAQYQHHHHFHRQEIDQRLRIVAAAALGKVAE